MDNRQNKELVVKQLSLRFAHSDAEKIVLDRVDFRASTGEFLAVIGRSGCGKSTLLQAVAGILNEYDGEITFSGDKITRPDCRIGMIFQEAALFPWLNVWDNIAYGLRRKREEPQQIREKVTLFLSEIGLSGYENYYPAELSGGMQQRVSLARTLILEPDLILMDEPFSALDFQTRMEMQNLTLRLWGHYKPTIVFVTHDIDEAIYLSDRVIVLDKNPGRIIATLDVPFERPRDLGVMATPEFSSLKVRILRVFTDGVKPRPIGRLYAKR